MEGFWFRVQGLGFRVWGLGFRIYAEGSAQEGVEWSDKHAGFRPWALKGSGLTEAAAAREDAPHAFLVFWHSHGPPFEAFIP